MPRGIQDIGDVKATFRKAPGKPDRAAMEQAEDVLADLLVRTYLTDQGGRRRGKRCQASNTSDLRRRRTKASKS